MSSLQYYKKNSNLINHQFMITEKPNMSRKLKRISILYFYVKKRDITFVGDGEDSF